MPPLSTAWGGGVVQNSIYSNFLWRSKKGTEKGGQKILEGLLYQEKKKFGLASETKQRKN